MHLGDEWAHTNGFTLQTTDNPRLLITLCPGFDLGRGWMIEPDQIEADVCVWGIRVRAKTFTGLCGPGRERALIARLLEIEASLATAQAGFL